MNILNCMMVKVESARYSHMYINFSYWICSNWWELSCRLKYFEIISILLPGSKNIILELGITFTVLVIWHNRARCEPVHCSPQPQFNPMNLHRVYVYTCKVFELSVIVSCTNTSSGTLDANIMFLLSRRKSNGPQLFYLS